MRGGISWTMSSTCIQSGGLPHGIGGYQASIMMEPKSPAPAWPLHGIVPKQEPQDPDTRNDSGVASSYNSASEFTSSPGSENSRDSTQNIPNPVYYSSPAPSTSFYNVHSTPSSSHSTFNPLTPPSTEPINSPGSVHSKTGFQSKNEMMYESTSNAAETTLTPSASPSGDDSAPNVEDHLRQLQLSLEKNGYIHPALGSPKGSENSMDDSSIKDDEMEDYDEQAIRVPKVNSHGKVKTFKCKQCDFFAITKLDFWDHSKVHIKNDKMLTCPKCPFVTEYKHHLEYHLRNHFGSKPFKCDKCNYSCVNKSMLNSHLKSHSNVYQYRCADCSYATKYCHSLKLHLRKYAHKPAMVLNPDGSPNPLPIIDVYGTRRGPKNKSTKAENASAPTSPMPQAPIFPHFMLQNGQPQIPLPFHYLMGAFGGVNPLMFPPQQIEQMMQQKMSIVDENDNNNETKETETNVSDNAASEDDPNGALDLSTTIAPKNRRKGKAFKLERPLSETGRSSAAASSSSSSEEDHVAEPSNTPSPPPEATEPMITAPSTINNNKPDIYNCQYCDIAFRDVVMYTMHMGYHGYNDPFTCNMCGEHSTDKVSFFLHIARTQHS